MISVYIRHRGPWEKIGAVASWSAARLLINEWLELGYRVVAKTLTMETPEFFAR